MRISLRRALAASSLCATLLACSISEEGTATPSPDAAPGDDDSGVGPGPDGAVKDSGGGSDATPDADAGPQCGRLTTPCKAGGHCDGPPDCESKVCRSNVCQDAAPADGVKNGDETDVDCGGSKAPACADGKACLVKDDCTSGVCTTNVCQVPTDSDGVKNGDETGVDCGGSSSKKCAPGQGCNTTADCDKVKCDTVGKVCLTASHSDGIVNDGETGIDCGGLTGAPKCATGQGCLSNADCNAVACDVGATNLCLPPSHTDGIQNDGETGIDCGGAALPTRCPPGQGCASTADCLDVKCDVGATNLCLPASHVDGIKNDGETGIDCGGAALPVKCAPGQGCGADADCNNVRCNMISLVCDPPTSGDGLQNGTETDVDCGGGAPTNAAPCAQDKACNVPADCASTFCNSVNKVCVAGQSCVGAPTDGITTCGAAGNDSCCRTLPVPGIAVKIDKYNITAGRMRQFVTAVGGDMRGYMSTHRPAWWDSTWEQYLPTMLDNGQVTPDDTPAYSGVYQELGPYVHGTFGGGNEGCNVKGPGARTYRIPDAVNTRMADPQYYTQAFLDQRALNCVTVHIIAAFCAWDGGQLPTRQQLDVAWGVSLDGRKYPWGATAPAGYDAAYPTEADPSREAYGAFNAGPFVNPPFNADRFWANYNYDYWGGAAQSNTDYSIFVAPPGRFPNGDGPYGHSDLAGAVFNSVDINGGGANAYWSRSGSWQGHTIPWTSAGTWQNFPVHYKYWAMGGRCARP